MTVLIVGGSYQNKGVIARLLHPELPVTEDLQLLVRKELETGGDPSALLPELLGRTVTCDEIGCGVVPVDPKEEKWREETGRLCCALAAQADEVYRVWAGISQRIK